MTDSSRYRPDGIERRWQQQWDEAELYRTPAQEGPTFYALSMFPYPSGTLHMGHVRNYVITDVIARVQRMRGRRVLHPMGWDAFGLPAENAAIERGVDPAEWTAANIEQMRGQLRRLGLSIDWSREIATCDPAYYRWTQWLFLQFLEAGLAYRNDATVNWDPVDGTVLANEQVDAEGRSWRSGAVVEKRRLRQWFLRITDYAEALLGDLGGLDGWPERVRTMQAHWIGRSRGTEIDFEVVGQDGTPRGERLTVFTTRADTLHGATYLVLAPEHPLVSRLTAAEHAVEVAALQDLVSRQSEQERTAEDRPKRGVPIGAWVRNPASGEPIPLWIADYVLAEYGTGAVMGVPAHDQRDFLFARRHELPVRQVIIPEGSDEHAFEGGAWTGPGVMIHSGPYDGMGSEEARAAITAAAAAGGWGRERVQYRLRDWLISRQRYWGCPIPVIHCDTCGVVPVPEDQRPVELPRGVALRGKGASPLAQLESWVRVPCPSCGRPARRETDTMDTFICSSWYFLRYCDPHNRQLPFGRTEVDRWMPVDQYVGGIEHAILHLLYARFFTKVLRDRGLLASGEPFTRLLTQGMVQGITYRNPHTGRYVPPAEVSDPSDPRDPHSGEVLETFYEKMSKSKHNGVDPGRVIERYGADTARMFILFKAPPEKDLEWDDADVEGQYRFLQRLWRLVEGAVERGLRLAGEPPAPPAAGTLSPAERELRRAVHGAIAAVSDDLEGELQLNTAVAELMKLSNAMATHLAEVGDAVACEALRVLVLLLAPFAPHLAEELWLQLGGRRPQDPLGSGSIHLQSWPVADPAALVRDTIPLVIQVKGKVRGNLEVPADADAATLEKLALASDVAARWLEGRPPRRVIVVPGKLVNLVP
ncbi:MAG: leucine--tRNA ligase [Synechococcaceae cyanobacterium]|nr:leucine--tRNA ligase [Synechococcaceae cyanobacterium]